jgi:NADPH:quinone reductase-like Zn-dependent oxidoreductase
VNDSTDTPYFFYVAANRPQLTELARLVDRGKIRPLVDSVLPLARAREAYERTSRRGKVVLEVAH